MKSRALPFIRLLLPVVLSAIVFVSPARACWVAEKLGRMVQNSPLIVFGEVTRVEVNKDAVKDPAAKDTAYVKVERIIKNAGNVGIVPGKTELAVPMDPEPLKISTAFRFQKGQRGVWLLSPVKNDSDPKGGNKYLVPNPQYLQPAESEAEIVKEVQAGADG